MLLQQQQPPKTPSSSTGTNVTKDSGRGSSRASVGDVAFSVETKEMVLGKHLVNLTEVLGCGSFGIVYAGKHATSGKKVAVKKLTINDEEAGRLALEEIKKYERLPKHPYLVEMIDYHYQKNAFWLVLEYCTDGTLEQFVCR